jgi:hypothetical protein
MFFRFWVMASYIVPIVTAYIHQWSQTCVAWTTAVVDPCSPRTQSYQQISGHDILMVSGIPWCSSAWSLDWFLNPSGEPMFHICHHCRKQSAYILFKKFQMFNAAFKLMSLLLWSQYSVYSHKLSIYIYLYMNNVLWNLAYRTSATEIRAKFWLHKFFIVQQLSKG